ncbi:hypothetical protein PVK06_021180 [Gossypium arboreum]|uniref:Uncharacterized protein n=1 Tax=Gossypium arboreum TaxID=29729 RepID=A0ABR0PPA5_GOSAR|nr:hypothetical protein PVK06_021180 [Gossypium arboreum]
MLARPSASSTPLSLLDFPLKSHSAKKISSLYEIEYLSEDDKVQPTDLPTVNPYNAYRKSAFSLVKSIRTLIKEQFVTLEIPAEFSAEWKRVGYTHIHFGAIRLALNYHGTPGKPVVTRIALLDSRYLEYQNACIAIIKATLNSGLVMIVYRIQDHAFNLSRHGIDDSLFLSINTNDQPHCIHVPRKIPKKELIKLLPEKWITSYEQLLEHSQPIQSTTSKITSKGDGTTEIKFDHSHFQSPKNPSTFPTQLMMQPIERPAQLHDQEDPDCCCPLCESVPKRSLIQSFSVDGKPLYMFKDLVTGYYPWALSCSCELCANDQMTAWIDSMDKTASKPGKKRKKKNSTQSEFYKRWMEGDPDISPLGEDNGKFIYLVDYSSHKSSPNTQVPPEPCKPPSLPPSKSFTLPLEKISKPSRQKLFLQPCYKKINKWVKKNPDFLASQNPVPTVRMMQPTASYDKEFPPLEEYLEKNYTHEPKIPSKIQIDISGTP